MVPGHDGDEEGEVDEHVDEADGERRDGDDEAREVDFADQVGVADDAGAGGFEGRGEELPGEEAAEDDDGVGGTLAGELGEASEDDGEDEGGDHGAQRAPQNAEYGLLVAYGEVAPGEDEDEFAVLPKVAPILTESGAGFYDGFLHGAHFSTTLRAGTPT